MQGIQSRERSAGREPPSVERLARPRARGRVFGGKLDGRTPLAVAAYNAGPGRARAWRDSQSMEAAIYAESIPFNETRDYVKRVMANSSYYAHNFSQQMQSLKARIGVIEPRVRDREKSLGDTP